MSHVILQFPAFVCGSSLKVKFLKSISQKRLLPTQNIAQTSVFGDSNTR